MSGLSPWNLHQATVAAAAKLDFLVLFSSLSGIIGQPGQANYASTNTFLDAFSQYRTGLGLAASVVDIGAVEEVGFISENHGLLSKMRTTGFKGITEQELLDAMVVAMLAHSQPASASPRSRSVDPNTFVLGLGSAMPLTSPANRAVWRKDRRMAAYHNAGVDGGGADAAASNEALKVFMASVKDDPVVLKTVAAAKVLAAEIGRKLFDLLLKPQEELRTVLPLVDLGLGSLDALGQHAADELLKAISEAAEEAAKGGS